MPFAKVLLEPGADFQSTPTLNKTKWASTQHVRFYKGLLQKLGGWAHYCATPVIGTCRALLGWADLTGNTYVATGTEQRLQVIVGGSPQDITPIRTLSNPAVSFSTVINTPTVTITDSNLPIQAGDWINLVTQVSVGGLVLFGYYQAVSIGGGNYTITAASNATATVVNGGAVAAFATINSSTTVTVTLANHGLTATSSSYALPFPVVVGNITLMGGYIVQSVINSSQFTIAAASSASGVYTASQNGGNARIQYLISNGFATNFKSGYGAGLYGSGDYGLANLATASIQRLWALDHWGQDLVAAPLGGTIYYWQPNNSGYAIFTGSITGYVLTSGAPTTGLIAAGQTLAGAGVTANTTIVSQLTGTTGGAGTYQVSISQSVSSESMASSTLITTAQSVSSTAPLYVNWLFVVPEVQILMTLGAESGGTQYPLLVRWSDAADFTTWTPTVSNQAGSFQLNSGSYLVFGAANGLTIYLWTDLGVWSVTYQGLPYVFSFNELARECGAIGPNAVVISAIGAVWLSNQGFFQLTGSGVQPMECPVWDFYNNGVDNSQLQSITGALNTQFHEISWFFPRINNTTGYVKWNWLANVWDFGVLTRTAWIDASPAGGPMGVDGSGLVQQHEVANDADGQPLVAGATSGYFDVAEGDEYIFTDMLIPDFVASNGAVISLTLLSQDYPGGTVKTDGPYAITVNGTSGLPTNFVTTQSRGRQMAIRLQSVDAGSSWRLGALRYRFAPDGKL